MFEFSSPYSGLAPGCVNGSQFELLLSCVGLSNGKLWIYTCIYSGILALAFKFVTLRFREIKREEKPTGAIICEISDYIDSALYGNDYGKFFDMNRDIFSIEPEEIIKQKPPIPTP